MKHRSSIGHPGLDMGVSWLGHGSVVMARHGHGGHGFFLGWYGMVIAFWLQRPAACAGLPDTSAHVFWLQRPAACVRGARSAHMCGQSSGPWAGTLSNSRRRRHAVLRRRRAEVVRRARALHGARSASAPARGSERLLSPWSALFQSVVKLGTRTRAQRQSRESSICRGTREGGARARDVVTTSLAPTGRPPTAPLRHPLAQGAE